MRKLITLVSLCIVCVCANAQTIHWITFFDTNDIKIGEGEVNTRKYMYSHFIEVINAALSEKGYIADINDYYSDATNPLNCKNIVEGLDVSQDDIIFFYYGGHGVRPDVDKEDISKHPFPQMCLGQSSDDSFIPLEWVHKTLKSKGARLVITVGSCCNSTHPLCSPKEKPVFIANYQSASVAQNQVEAIQEMFLGYTGDIIATEASPTEYGWVGDFFGYFYHIYGGGLVTTFESYTQSHKYDIKDFFETVAANCQNEAALHDLSMHPVTWTNVRKVSEPDERPREEPRDFVVQDPLLPQQPQYQQQPNNRTRSLNNDLLEYFDYIADAALPLDIREIQAEKLKDRCSSSAVVKILAQDVDVVVDKEEISDFCDRISISERLLQVTPVDAKVEGNQITEIRVREYYKQ